mgnify:CR=1 FL=1
MNAGADQAFELRQKAEQPREQLDEVADATMLMSVPRPIWYLSSANTAAKIARFTSSWNVPKSMPTRALNPGSWR